MGPCSSGAALRRSHPRCGEAAQQESQSGLQWSLEDRFADECAEANDDRIQLRFPGCHEVEAVISGWDATL